MKVFLIIIGIIVISEILEFILNVVNSILQKKQLENEVALLKSRLQTADYLIKHNNEVIEGMARNASLYYGTMLDEYYLCGEDMTREQAKEEVKNRSCVDKFAKPRKNDGVYALIMESNQFFYDRFNVTVDTICFNCHKPIKGKMKDFPNMNRENEEKYYFCCWDCKKRNA